MQSTLLSFVGRESDEDARVAGLRARGQRPLFVDLFCGIGGASTGAMDAGYEVVLAVDCDARLLALHKKNHSSTRHLCKKLPPKRPLPLPNAADVWHLHGSPPCQKLSRTNQLSNTPADRLDGLAMVRWYVQFALDSDATTWSLEQVAMPDVLELLDEFKAQGSPHRDRIAYHVFDFYELGVPQHRRRVIAGSPCVVARLQRTPRVHRSVKDVIEQPRGTHVKGQVRYTKRRVNGKHQYVELTKDMGCTPISGPAFVTLAYQPLKWATPYSGAALEKLNPRETASLQMFPQKYRLEGRRTLINRGVGNAVPPCVMTQMLCDNQRSVSPSFMWQSRVLAE